MNFFGFLALHLPHSKVKKNGYLRIMFTVLPLSYLTMSKIMTSKIYNDIKKYLTIGNSEGKKFIILGSSVITGVRFASICDVF